MNKKECFFRQKPQKLGVFCRNKIGIAGISIAGIFKGDSEKLIKTLKKKNF
ncbi:MAG: hypothetical protein ACOX7H_01885 [Bacillota bacterium]|jgi:hypothetical protein